MLRILAIAAILLLPGFVCCQEPSSNQGQSITPSETSSSTKWKVAGGVTIGGVSIWVYVEKFVKTAAKVG